MKDTRIDEIDFKKYVMLRKEAFETRYGLNNFYPSTNRLYKQHYINNLRYLDGTSQLLIRAVNEVDTSIRDKIVTCLVYALVPDKKVLRRYSSEKGIYNLNDVYNLATYLDSGREKLLFRYQSAILKESINGLTKGNYLLACVEDLIRNIPEDKFKGYSTKKVYSYFIDNETFGIGGATLYNFICNLTYINELLLDIELFSLIPNPVKSIYKEITGIKVFNYKDYEKFTESIIDWYVKLNFLDPRERLVTPLDIAHMLKSYAMYKGKTRGVERWRDATKRKHKIESVVITESIYEYFRKKRVRSEVH